MADFKISVKTLMQIDNLVEKGLYIDRSDFFNESVDITKVECENNYNPSATNFNKSTSCDFNNMKEIEIDWMRFGFMNRSDYLRFCAKYNITRNYNEIN